MKKGFVVSSHSHKHFCFIHHVTLLHNRWINLHWILALCKSQSEDAIWLTKTCYANILPAWWLQQLSNDNIKIYILTTKVIHSLLIRVISSQTTAYAWLNHNCFFYHCLSSYFFYDSKKLFLFLIKIRRQ